jgi:hypothetical protein
VFVVCAGDSFLSQLDLSRDTLGRDIGILAAMVGIYIIAAFVLLHLRVRAGRMVRTRSAVVSKKEEP